VSGGRVPRQGTDLLIGGHSKGHAGTAERYKTVSNLTASKAKAPFFGAFVFLPRDQAEKPKNNERNDVHESGLSERLHSGRFGLGLCNAQCSTRNAQWA